MNKLIKRIDKKLTSKNLLKGAGRKKKLKKKKTDSFALIENLEQIVSQ